MAYRLDISQKKLYEKLTILEKYCIKLEKRISVLEGEKKESKSSSKSSSKNTTSSSSGTNVESISTQTTNQPKKQTKKVKKLFDKYKMNPVNI